MSTRESTRTRLLDATEALVFTQGVLSTPVDRILELAAVSPATLYRAYGSKEALVAAALARRHAHWVEVWDEAVARADDDRGRLLAVLDALGDFRSRPEGARWCAFLGTAAEYADPPPPLAAALAEETATLREGLRRHAGPVAPARADWLAEALLLVVSGELAMRLRGPGSPHLAREVATALVDSVARATD